MLAHHQRKDNITYLLSQRTVGRDELVQSNKKPKVKFLILIIGLSSFVILDLVMCPLV
jgi:hypothetical protein